MSGTREQVARIIDPETFELIEHYNALDSNPRGEEGTFKAYPQLRERHDTAFAKADAILATLLASQEAEIAELHLALKPFAAYARLIDGRKETAGYPDACPIALAPDYVGSYPTVGDLRQAAALRPAETGEPT